ncbi:MAG: methyltransferase domain-containing protein [Granulosicoccus sp.]
MHQSGNSEDTDVVLDAPLPSKARIYPVGGRSERVVVRSNYLVKRLFETPENNLFNYVKFNLVNQQIKRIGGASPKVMDVGCGLQVAGRFLKALNSKISYFGIDYEPSFEPHAVVDLNRFDDLNLPMRWDPDVVMLLDVLEHLHEEETDLRKIIGHIAQSMPDKAHLIVTVPQWYRLDCLKLAHLHYPEHKIRLTQREWRSALEEHFEVTATQGVGFLSVIPYLPMAFRHYTPDNILGKLFRHLRSTTFEKRWIKSLDLFLSNTLGKLLPFKHLSNDILFVAKPLNRRSSNKS